jgi:MFS family permease
VKLPRAVWLFSGTSFTNDLASEMIYPLLPAFVSRGLGGGALALGVVDGVAETVAAAFKVASGYLADRPRIGGRLVVLGYAVAAMVRPLIALAGAAWHVVVLRGVDRLGKGLRTSPRDALIARVTSDEVRGRAYGLHRGADHAGAVLGSLLAAGLLAAGLAERSVFWIAAAPGAMAAFLAWMAVKALNGAGAPARAEDLTLEPLAPESASAAGSGKAAFPARHALRTTVLTLSLVALIRVPELLLILRVQQLGVSTAAVPALWAALHVVRSAASYPGGQWSDRWGARPTLALGWVCYAVFAWDLAVAVTATQATVIFLAFGLVAGLTESPERKLVAALAPEGRHGRSFGWYHGSVAAVSLPGAALMGWLYQEEGARTALVLSAAGTLLASLLLVATRQRSVA